MIPITTHDLSVLWREIDLMRTAGLRLDDTQAVELASDLSGLLPASALAVLEVFRDRPTEPAVLLRGPRIDEAPPTPTSAARSVHIDKSDALSLFMMALMYPLGRPLSWQSQQEGRLVQDIVPIPGDEYRQVNSSSLTGISLHTEDSFARRPPHFVGLMCIRNPDAVSTNIASITSVDLSERTWQILGTKRFLASTDMGHATTTATDKLVSVRDHDELGGTFFRFDPDYLAARPGDSEAEEAYHLLHAGLIDKTDAVALQPGDLLIIDNALAAHGRDAFGARYNGTDRWLKRMTVAGASMMPGITPLIGMEYA